MADLRRAAELNDPLDGFSPLLGWSHYRLLMKVEHVAARRFYELEAERCTWAVDHLERQIHTQLFIRLLKSRDKAGVMDLASRGQVIERPSDTIKHPYVLDFLALAESPRLRESDLESAILEKLQHFLLELGKGFAFIARQKRLSFEDDPQRGGARARAGPREAHVGVERSRDGVDGEKAYERTASPNAAPRRKAMKKRHTTHKRGPA